MSAPSPGSDVTPPTGTIALVFTDVQGSTKLWDRHTDVMRAALEVHDRLMRDAIAKHGGYEVKTEGDSFMVAFASGLAAVRWCLDVQLALADAPWPEALLAEDLASVEHTQEGQVLRRGLRVRMGVHAGDPVTKQDPVTGRMDYFGPSVNRAARVGSSGHGGQIVVSERIWKQISGELDGLDAVAVDLGTHRLKDLESAEHLWQVLPRRFGARSFPPLKTLDARKTNLTPHPTPFVGREADLGALRSLFAAGERLVTLTGPGGTGKTRLSMRYAAVHLDDFPGGAWFIDLTEARTLDGVSAAVGRALNVPLTTGRTSADTLDQLARAIAGLGRVLLVMDNFEQVVAHAPDTLKRWMDAAPEARFLVSSQERLRLPGESLYELTPLSVPEDPRAAAESEAVQLFVQRAQAVRRDYVLGEQDVPLVAQIVRELDGIPLAIELAAARMGVLSAAKLLERLPRRLDLLAGARRDATSRQATLRGAIDWSWSLLRPYEQDALAQASVFHGGFTLEAAEEVLDLSAHAQAPWSLDAVQALRDKSLLRAWEPPETPGELRFGMYSNIREYAAEKLAASGSEDRANRRHATWALRYGGALANAVYGKDGTSQLRRLALETDNLVAVFLRACAVEPPTVESATDAIECVRILDPVLSTRGPYGSHLEWLDLALCRAASAAIPPERRASVLGLRARARRLRGQMQDALADLAEAEPLAGADGGLLASLLSEKAWLLHLQGRSDEARALLGRAIELSRSSGNRRAESEALKRQGAMLHEAFASAEALESYRLATEVARRSGDRWGEAETIANTGIVLRRLGRLGEARESYEEALALQREAGNRAAEGTLLGNIAGLLLELGDYDAAERRYAEAIAIQKQVGNARSQAFFVGNSGILEHLRGRYEAARRNAERASSSFRDLGESGYEALYSAYRGAAEAALGDIGAARASFEAARATFVKQADAINLAFVDLLSGLLDVSPSVRSTEGLARASGRIADAEGPRGPGGTPLAATSEDIRFAIRILRAAIGGEVNRSADGGG